MLREIDSYQERLERLKEQIAQGQDRTDPLDELEDLIERERELQRQTASLRTESDLINDLRFLWEKLPYGRIAFQPRTRVRQGQEEIYTARLTDQSQLDLLEGLGEGFTVEAIKISASMALYLEGSEEEFLIEPLSSPEQALTGSVQEWRWRVTALKSGARRVFLRAVAKIHLPGEVMTTDLPVREAIIEVEVDPWWSVKRFAGLHWQWLLGSPVFVGGSGWLIVRLRRNRSRRAGF